MNNDDQDDRDSVTEGDAEKQLGFDAAEFDADQQRRKPTYDTFDSEQATEYDDLEAEDFGTEYVDDSSDFDGESVSLSDNLEDDGPLDIWQQADPDGASQQRDNESQPTADDDDEDGIDLWAETDNEEDELSDTGDSPDWAAREETVPGWSREEASGESWTEDNSELTDQDWDDETEELDSGPDPDDEFTEEEQDSESWQTALDDEEWDEEPVDDEPGFLESWPIGLIVVAVIALLLLAAGGYGVMQQRAAMQEEIRDLRAQLATAARPQQVTDSRDAQRELTERNTRLQQQLDSLALENRQLSDTVTGLESQLEAQRNAAIKLEEARAAARRQAAARAPTSAPAPAPAPAPTSSTAASQATASPASTPGATGGNWFVNFGSYSQQGVASDWAARLQPSYGKVIVAPATANGKTVYRVRVIDLPSKAEAEQISLRLQKEYQLPTLWVGSQ